MESWPRAVRRGGVAAVATAALTLLLLPKAVLLPALTSAAATARDMARGTQRQAVLAGIRSWPHLSGSGITVYYAPGLRGGAALVAAAAQRYWPAIRRDYALPQDMPAVLIVLSPGAMVRHVGGGYAGAYYEGVDWITAPPAGRAGQDFLRTGPVPHELTHLANAVAGDGRAPAWFNEGLAQYEDWRLTGYVWMEPGSGFAGPDYTWGELTGTDFYALQNQALAYRQALAATAYICRRGPGVCLRVLHLLRAGRSMSTALLATVGAQGLQALESGHIWRGHNGPQAWTRAGPRP